MTFALTERLHLVLVEADSEECKPLLPSLDMVQQQSFVSGDESPFSELILLSFHNQGQTFRKAQIGLFFSETAEY